MYKNRNFFFAFLESRHHDQRKYAKKKFLKFFTQLNLSWIAFYVKQPHTLKNVKKYPHTHPQICQQVVQSQYNAVRPSNSNFRSLPHYVKHPHSLKNIKKHLAHTHRHANIKFFHNTMPLDQAKAISAHCRITYYTPTHTHTHSKTSKNTSHAPTDMPTSSLVTIQCR